MNIEELNQTIDQALEAIKKRNPQHHESENDDGVDAKERYSSEALFGLLEVYRSILGDEKTIELIEDFKVTDLDSFINGDCDYFTTIIQHDGKECTSIIGGSLKKSDVDKQLTKALSYKTPYKKLLEPIPIFNEDGSQIEELSVCYKKKVNGKSMSIQWVIPESLANSQAPEQKIVTTTKHDVFTANSSLTFQKSGSVKVNRRQVFGNDVNLGIFYDESELQKLIGEKAGELLWKKTVRFENSMNSSFYDKSFGKYTEYKKTSVISPDAETISLLRKNKELKENIEEEKRKSNVQEKALQDLLEMQLKNGALIEENARQLAEELSDTEKQKEEVQKQLELSKTQSAIQSSELEDLEKKLTSAQSEYGQSSEQVSELTQQLTQLKQNQLVKEEENQRLQQDTIAKEDQLQELARQLAESIKQKEDLEQLHNTVTKRLKSNLESARKKEAQKSRTIAELEANKKDLISENSVLAQESENLTEELDLAKQMNQELELQAGQLRKSNELLEKTNRSHISYQRSLGQQNMAIAEELGRQRAELSMISEEHQELLAIANHVLDMRESKQEELEKAAKKQQEIENRFIELTSIRESTFKKEEQKLQEQLQGAQREAGLVEQEMQEQLQRTQEEMELLKQEASHIIEILKADLDNNQAEVQNLKADKMELEREVTLAKNTVALYDETAKKEHLSRSHFRAQTAQARRDFEDRTDEIQRQNRIQADKIEELKEDAVHLELDNSRMERDLETAKDSLATTERELKNKTEDLAESNARLEKARNRISKQEKYIAHLEGYKDNFSDKLEDEIGKEKLQSAISEKAWEDEFKKQYIGFADELRSEIFKEYSERIATLEKELLGLTATNQKLEAANLTLESAHQDFEIRQAQKDKELQESKNIFKIKQAESDEIQKQLERYNKESTAQKEEARKLQIAHSMTQDHLRAENSQLKESLQVSKELEQALGENNEELSEELTREQKESAKLTAKLQELQKESNALKSKIEELQKENDDFKKATEQLAREEIKNAIKKAKEALGSKINTKSSEKKPQGQKRKNKAPEETPTKKRRGRRGGIRQSQREIDAFNCSVSRLKTPYKNKQPDNLDGDENEKKPQTSKKRRIKEKTPLTTGNDARKQKRGESKSELREKRSLAQTPIRGAQHPKSGTSLSTKPPMDHTPPSEEYDHYNDIENYSDSDTAIKQVKNKLSLDGTVSAAELFMQGERRERRRFSLVPRSFTSRYEYEIEENAPLPRSGSVTYADVSFSGNRSPKKSPSKKPGNKSVTRLLEEEEEQRYN